MLPAADGGRRTHDVPPDQLRAVDEPEKEDFTQENLNHALATAVYKKDLDKVAYRLAMGSDPNCCAEMQDGTTASMLKLASLQPKPSAHSVFLLLAARADPAASSDGWNLIDALRTHELDTSFKEDLHSFAQPDHEVMLEEYRRAGRTGECIPSTQFDKIDIASFLRNVRKQDLLHAAAVLCDFEAICELLVCGRFNPELGGEFDPNEEIAFSGAHFACPLSLVYYSRDKDARLCMLSLLAARADPHMPSSKMVLTDSSESWTLAGAARAAGHVKLVKILKQIPLSHRAVMHPKAAAKWVLSRIRSVKEVTTDKLKAMVDYILPCMPLDELVREVLAIRADSREDRDCNARFQRLANELLCLSAQRDDGSAVALLLRADARVASHDDSKRSAESTLPEPTARFLTPPARPA